MQTLYIINDVHLGVKRISGTTPLTQSQVSQYIQDEFDGYLKTHNDGNLLIDGDLFDSFEVAPQWVLACYFSLCNWLTRNPDFTLLLSAGNHDLHKNSGKLASFDLLAQLLTDRFENVIVIKEPFKTNDDGTNLYVVPHLPNQDLFNLALDEALNWDPGYLFLHANFDNNFAEEADHSLNVSMDQAKKLAKKHFVVFAHEHQYREPIDNVLIMGNNYPTSISDCLGNEQKFAWRIEDDGTSETSCRP